jgi:hypothetical protein
VDGPLIKEKALALAQDLIIFDFTASDGWLTRFRARHHLKWRQILGEAHDVDDGIVADWKSEVLIAPLLEEYPLQDIFNTDESALFWRSQQRSSIVMPGEDGRGRKGSKQRVSILTTANSTGTDEKLKILLIGRAKLPRSFRGVKTLPFDYEHNSKAWMLSGVWERFLKQSHIETVPQTVLKRFQSL